MVEAGVADSPVKLPVDNFADVLTKIDPALLSVTDPIDTDPDCMISLPLIV
jgi:hypothetical protein